MLALCPRGCCQIWAYRSLRRLGLAGLAAGAFQFLAFRTIQGVLSLSGGLTDLAGLGEFMLLLLVAASRNIVALALDLVVGHDGTPSVAESRTRTAVTGSDHIDFINLCHRLYHVD